MNKSILCDFFAKSKDWEGWDPYPCTPDIDPETWDVIVPQKQSPFDLVQWKKNHDERIKREQKQSEEQQTKRKSFISKILKM